MRRYKIFTFAWFVFFLFIFLNNQAFAASCECLEELGDWEHPYSEVRCTRLPENQTTCSSLESSRVTDCVFFPSDTCLKCANPTYTRSEYECRSDSQCFRFDRGVCTAGFCCLSPVGAKMLDEAPLFTTLGKDLEIKEPKLQFRFPGVKFSSVSSTLDSQGFIHLPYIGEFISGMYKLGMALGSIIAVVMVVLSGVRIIISAGGEEKQEGFKRIGQAIVGLFIMWGSYFILNTINPDLVNFKILKVMYIRPELIEIEGRPDTQDSKAQNLTVKAGPLNPAACRLSEYPSYGSKNNMFGTGGGYCLAWVKRSLNAACGHIPEMLDSSGAWNVAARFKAKEKFHACNLTGIKNGDIVFMTSLGSDYVGLWDNFRLGTEGCTIADASQKPSYWDKTTKKDVAYKVVEGNPQGMPPVTHIGVYYDGHVYHQIGSVEAETVSLAQPFEGANRDSKENWKIRKIRLKGNFLRGGSEFIAGYGTW